MNAEARGARRPAAVSGIAVALLFAVGSAIWGLDMPEDGTPVAEVVEFYRETADRIVIGAASACWRSPASWSSRPRFARC